MEEAESEYGSGGALLGSGGVAAGWVVEVWRRGRRCVCLVCCRVSWRPEYRPAREGWRSAVVTVVVYGLVVEVGGRYGMVGSCTVDVCHR